MEFSVARWLRQQLGQRQSPEQGDRTPTERIGSEERSPEPLNHLDLPTEWSMIHISLTRQALSDDQHLAIIRLAQWVPQREIHEVRSTEPRERQPTESGPTTKRIERTEALLKRVPHPELGVHICREDLPATAWRRKQATDRLGEVLAVFPDDQIQIWTRARSSIGPDRFG